jgi:hypothetical protein
MSGSQIAKCVASLVVYMTSVLFRAYVQKNAVKRVPPYLRHVSFSCPVFWSEQRKPRDSPVVSYLLSD